MDAELRERSTALDAPRIIGDRHDVFGDDVFGEEVEEVVRLDKSGEAFLDDVEERVERCEVFEVAIGVFMALPPISTPRRSWRRTL